MSTKLDTLRGSCLFLLLISQITCDWVEIEQDNYKPHRKLSINTRYDDHKSQVVSQYEETTKENNYRNNSVEKLWSKGMVDRVSNVGNIKRVQGPIVKTTAIKTKQEDTELSKNAPAMENTGDRHKYREQINIPHRHYFPNRPHILKEKNNEEEDFRAKESKHDEITNAGIKSTSSFKSSVNNFQYDKELHDEDKDVDFNINAPNKVKQTQTVHKNLSTNENKKNHLNDENDEHYNSNYQRIQIGQRRTSPRPNIFNNEELTTKKIKVINKSQSIENYNIQNSDHLDDIKYTNYTLSKPFGAYITKINNTNEKRNDFKKRPMIIKTEIYSVPAINNEEEVSSSASVTEEMPTNSKIISKSKEKNTMDGMLKLMKVVSDTIYKNTHRSFKSKVKYLEGLKSTILTTIEDHVDTLWPDDKDHTRHTREARGHVEFPSSESALMSISFLTFSVFLIKLVLQVIHTYKHKTMMVAPTVVAAVGRAARAIRNQQ